MNQEDLYNFTEIIYKGKSYKKEEIRKNSEVNRIFNQSLLFYPVSFIEKVKKQKGLIRLEFNEDNSINKSLINVSTELREEFYSVYN